MTGVIRFTAGNPTADEIAAVVAVVHAQAAAAAAVPPPKPKRSAWARPRHVRYAWPRSWDESRLPR